MPNSEKTDLIADIRSLMNRPVRRQSSYDSLGTHKLLDKLFVRLGLVIIIGLLGYIAIRGSSKEKECISYRQKPKKYREKEEYFF